MMLMLLGYYNPVVGSVSGLVDALLSANVGAALTCCGVLIPFGHRRYRGHFRSG